MGRGGTRCSDLFLPCSGAALVVLGSGRAERNGEQPTPSPPETSPSMETSDLLYQK